MGKITILEQTTKDPISLIGEVSGICYGSDTTDSNKNFRRGLVNIQSGHGRTMEYPQVYVVIDGYSARVMRELYTHIGGAPTRLQASTRYIKYGEFDYIIPEKIQNNEEALQKYRETMQNISDSYKALIDLGIPKEDTANILPLGMTSKMILRTNLRNLIDMSHQRLCTRAYWEFRQLMQDLLKQLGGYSTEWATLVNDKTLFAPKCEIVGYCKEHNSCGRKPLEEDFFNKFEN